MVAPLIASPEIVVGFADGPDEAAASPRSIAEGWSWVCDRVRSVSHDYHRAGALKLADEAGTGAPPIACAGDTTGQH